MIEIKDLVNAKCSIAIGTDHGGFILKNELIDELNTQDVNVVDMGAFIDDTGDDYCDFATAVAKAVALGSVDAGILICSSGVGMAMTANRYHNVRAAVATDSKAAKLSREHNCSNVLVLSGTKLDAGNAMEIVNVWLNSPYYN